MVLDKIQRPNDVKELKEQELPVLADEIRQFIIDKVSDNGGHLASNLGVVELTIALHRCLNFPQDKLIWETFIFSPSTATGTPASKLTETVVGVSGA